METIARLAQWEMDTFGPYSGSAYVIGDRAGSMRFDSRNHLTVEKKGERGLCIKLLSVELVCLRRINKMRESSFVSTSGSAGGQNIPLVMVS